MGESGKCGQTRPLYCIARDDFVAGDRDDCIAPDDFVARD